MKEKSRFTPAKEMKRIISRSALVILIAVIAMSSFNVFTGYGKLSFFPKVSAQSGEEDGVSESTEYFSGQAYGQPEAIKTITKQPLKVVTAGNQGEKFKGEAKCFKPSGSNPGTALVTAYYWMQSVSLIKTRDDSAVGSANNDTVYNVSWNASYTVSYLQTGTIDVIDAHQTNFL